MKNLSAISKKGIIVISAAIMIIAGALMALLPSTSQAMSGDGCGGGGGWGKLRTGGSSSGDIHVPILNNTGEPLTIRKMYIDTPGADELRVRTIYFVGEVNNSYTAGSKGYSQRRGGQTTNESNKIISLDNYYGFSNAKVDCQITFDNNSLPSGTYTIEYYFRYSGDEANRMNEVSFTLP